MEDYNNLPPAPQRPLFSTPNPPPVPPPAPQRASQSKGCLTGCLIAAGLMAGLALLCVVVFFATIGKMGKNFSEAFAAIDKNPDSDEAALAEVWSAGDGETRVARVHINGVIMLNNSDRWGGGAGSPDLALAGIRRATRDETVRGLIIEINSPGGGITASDILHNAVTEFKLAQPGRRVIVLMNDLAASGAYYVAVAADEIIAHPTTLTGSIGVIIQSYNISRLAGAVGVTDVTVKSGENKDLLNPFRPVDNEQVATLVQPLVDAMHARFVELVCAGRKLDPETLRPLADGRLFNAQTALENKLIDSIGYRAFSETRMEELLGAPITIFRYEERLGLGSLFRKSFMSFQHDAGLGATLKNMLETPDTKFMYLWRP